MLEALIAQFEASRTPQAAPPGNTVNMWQKSRVTAQAFDYAGGNACNIGNTKKAIDQSVSHPAPSKPTHDYLPEPWRRVCGLIHQGWRAEFSPPGPDSRQGITWHPPGTWTPEPGPGAEKPFRHRYENHAEPVRCCDCQHRQKTDHPALIRCGAGVPAPGGCGLWWNTDRHQCGQFEREIQ
jgi:hypothetical protein